MAEIHIIRDKNRHNEVNNDDDNSQADSNKAYRLLGFKVSVYEDRFTLTSVTNNDVCVT